jgi:FkbM family methyltransferase
MTKYYSQHGEDFILSELFKNREDGFFVEVGCIDGKRFSNTLTFEDKGWKGLCIEAHTDYIELLKQNRPLSIIEHCAVSNQDADSVTFYANSRGSLSTLDKSRENDFASKFGHFFTGFQEQLVPKRTLNTLFSKHSISEIDILSIDVEGHEIEVIQGLNLNKYKPKVLLIESDTKEHENLLTEIIVPMNYNKFCRIKQNIFFIEMSFNFPELKSKYNINLTHTKHPVDIGSDSTMPVEVIVNFY